MTYLCYLFVALMWDLREFRIPNLWILAGISLGVLSIHGGQVYPPLSMGIGIFYVSLLLPLFYLHMLGGGDIKIFYVSVLFLGSSVKYLILLSFFINGIYAFIQILYQGDFLSRLYSFFLYISRCVTEQKIMPYDSLMKEKKGDQLHFMVGVFFAYIMLQKDKLFA